MKKRTKEILSGVLVVSILLCTPAGMEAVQAAGQKRADQGRLAAVQADLHPDVPDREDAVETTSESLSEPISEDTSEIRTEDTSEETSETISENISEAISEEVSEDMSENTSENLSEIESETESGIGSEYELVQVSESDSEFILEEITEIKGDMEEEWVEIPAICFSPEIADDGELDYRTYIDSAADIMVKVRKEEAEQDTFGSIKVKNSPLYDSDFYIELSKDGQVQQYGYTEWIKYLESRKEWVNDKVEVKLSDTGKKYFDSIQMEVQEDKAGRGKKKYTFWAENSGLNASTKNIKDGTRSYTAGRDTEKPVLKDLSTDSECYEPTKTETEQYFAKDFILNGSFCDDGSGVSRIEYTTDMRPEENSVWIEVENTQESAESTIHFQVALSDGCYPAIAVRAADEAGNVSEAGSFVNDAGEYIKVVVDGTAPVLAFDVSAKGQPYNGENDNWTNQDVRIAVTPDKNSCIYAGIGQYEYTYVKIGENMTDVSEKWTELPVLDKSLAELEIMEDKNGYYLFRAVSKSGIETTEDAKLRILIQHQVAQIKPILVSGADEAKCKNGWYNKQSGTPKIHFEYPDYDTGAISGEYDAPITIHYQLAKRDSIPATPESVAPEEAGKAQVAEGTEKKAVIGVMNCKDVTINADGKKEFVLTKDDLNQYFVDFGNSDGFYTLKYWTTDKAGNESEKQISHYKIDCHAPTDLAMELAGSAFEVGKEAEITYQRFYNGTISGSAGAQYGISGKGSLVIKQVKKIGEWKDLGGDWSGNQDNVSIFPNSRCFLYIRAEDAAGNTAEGWTNGIVVDNMAPNESAGRNNRELMIAPEGANEHGFFNDDVMIDIRIKDAPDDNNCAALKLVTSSVGRDGTDTIARQELFSFTKEAPTEAEIIAASGFQCMQLIDAKANESNEAYIEVTATDRSGNTKTSTQLLKIDVTKPEIDIRFDNNDVVNGNYYSQGRTATVHVHELNFNPDAVSVLVTRDGQTSEAALSDWISDGSEHYATIAFMEDGEYSITANCVDLADNASDEIQSGTFIIDCTAPEMTIELTDGRGARTAGKEYFNTGVTAVITVTEHNFRTEDFKVNMTPIIEKGIWSHEGDIHTLRISFAGDDVYHIEGAYTDMAGNPANTIERDFTIDTTAPVIMIDGVDDGSANSGAVLPVISVLDPNIEASDISVSVMTGIGDVIENSIETALVNGGSSTGYRLKLNDMTEKPDNIYYLSVSACDQAGNSAELTYRFSLNRTGSVYDLTSLVHLMERQYNTFGALDDIRIVEMNIDTVEEFELYVSRNGALGYEAEYTREMSGSSDTGYTYVYKIDKENFAEEGVYRLTLYSRDRAGNEVNNAADIHGSEITFIIDNTAPKVIIDGVESGMVYDAEGREVHVVVTDNFKLTKAELTLVNRANEVLQSWDYIELVGENDSLDITIPQHGEMVSLLYRVKDAAGNEMQTYQGEQTALNDFLVTTDKYVQFINRPSQTSAGRCMLLMTGASVALVLAAGRILHKRKRRNGGLHINTCN